MTAPAAPLFACAVERMATIVDAHRDYRVLRRMRPMRRTGFLPLNGRALVGCALDVETTGLDVDTDAVIELAIQRFWADPSGNIVVAGTPHSWLEDPKRPISPEITALTRISDADVRGRTIIDPVAASLIADADFVVAHNAAFDRPFVEKRLPFAAGRLWVCTMRDVDWRGLGFEGRTLSHLLAQMGWFYEAHRASTDVTALLHLLDHPIHARGTVLGTAVDVARRPTCVVEAVGAPFEAKDALKNRGYRWNPASRCWWKEVPSDSRDQEVAWTVLHAYGGRSQPSTRYLTWKERYRRG